MKPTVPTHSAAVSAESVVQPSEPRYELRLYVAGTTPRSTRAIANINKICVEHLQGHYDLKVIDLYQQPLLAKGDQIIAVPTLIRELPPPLRRIIGDLSDALRQNKRLPKHVPRETWLRHN
ncbi:MAG: circadian clock protein KaiB [Lentisphaerae bacterium]|nr:circadian clock protein KaiB [Lentisphaerota bacterium]